MRKPTLVFFVLVATFHRIECSSSSNSDSSDSKDGKERDGKVFSLFSIVAFKNTGCRSTSAVTTGQSLARNGTCFTASECSAKGGTSSGNCAAGFGVCCLFLVSTSGATIDQNCTYLRNPNFPNTLTTTTQLSYTVKKTANDICQLRLDFEQFNILPPALEDSQRETTQASSLCDLDALTITATNSGRTIPPLCGLNTGQHMYIDLGNTPTDQATLAFSFNGVNNARIWEIKISQIECTNPNRPPDGCTQYWTTLTGRISTFNFFQTDINLQGHLANQDVSVCIRKEPGFCCIKYTVCNAGTTDAFSLDATTQIIAGIAVSQVDTLCANDYAIIPGGAATCGGKVLHSKFCSSFLDPLTSNLGINVPVCSCSPPFKLTFHTDALGDVITGVENTVSTRSRGNCLDFTQVPCA